MQLQIAQQQQENKDLQRSLATLANSKPLPSSAATSAHTTHSVNTSNNSTTAIIMILCVLAFVFLFVNRLMQEHTPHSVLLNDRIIYTNIYPYTGAKAAASSIGTYALM